MTAKSDSAPSLRIDKWLWHARFCKTRNLAIRLCQAGVVSIDGRAAKPSQLVKIGFTITLAHADYRRIVTVLALGIRRGPADEARGLYQQTAESQLSDLEPIWESLFDEDAAHSPLEDETSA